MCNVWYIQCDWISLYNTGNYPLVLEGSNCLGTYWVFLTSVTWQGYLYGSCDRCSQHGGLTIKLPNCQGARNYNSLSNENTILCIIHHVHIDATLPILQSTTVKKVQLKCWSKPKCQFHEYPFISGPIYVQKALANISVAGPAGHWHIRSCSGDVTAGPNDLMMDRDFLASSSINIDNFGIAHWLSR